MSGMDQEAKNKGKKKAEDRESSSSGINHTLQSSPPVQQPSLDPLPPFSSSSTAPCSSPTEPAELVQEAKRHKLTLQQAPSQSPSSPAAHTSLGPRIPLSSIPPANQRPLFSPRPPRPPRPPSSSDDPPTTADRAAGTKTSANFFVHGRESRLQAKFAVARQRGRQRKPGRVMETRPPPGPSRLKPGPPLPPYDFVKEVIIDINDFITQMGVARLVEKSQPPDSAPETTSFSATVTAHATTSSEPTKSNVTSFSGKTPSSAQITTHATSSSAAIAGYATSFGGKVEAHVTPSYSPILDKATSFSGGGSSSGLEVEKEILVSVEDVMEMLEEYMERIPRTVSEEEMEEKLKEFQIKMNVDPEPSWYSLMKKSNEAFWECLTEYFIIDALENDEEEEDDDDSDADQSS